MHIVDDTHHCELDVVPVVRRASRMFVCAVLALNTLSSSSCLPSDIVYASSYLRASCGVRQLVHLVRRSDSSVHADCLLCVYLLDVGCVGRVVVIRVLRSDD